MTVEEVQALIVDNEEYNKIKNDFKGTNIEVTISTKNSREINYNLDRGFWGARVPEIQNNTLILRLPKDENPIRTVVDSKLNEIYRQQEYCIPCEDIINISYSYDRLVVSDIQEEN